MKMAQVAAQLYTIRDHAKTARDFAASMKRIVAVAEGSGCRWFIVEQDTCPGDPFESLRKSFEYIKENLCT